MKIPYFAVAVAAGLVQVGGSPAPIRPAIAELEPSNEPDISRVPHPLPYRFGLATAPQDAKHGEVPPFAVIRVGGPTPGPALSPNVQRRPCGRFKAQAIRVSNSVRKALGMPLIRVEEYKLKNGITVGTLTVTRPVHPEHPHPHPYPPAHSYHHHPPGRHAHPMGHVSITEEPFAIRLHFALSSLGRWEGRAVAFVLGCGIGVLLRMFWVLAIISYRLMRGSPAGEQQEYEYQHILFEDHDAEDILVAPPTYVAAVDEKTDLVLEEEGKEQAAK